MSNPESAPAGERLLPARRLPSIRSLWLPVFGMRLHVRTAGSASGEAPVVVLVHGLGVSSLYMEPLVRFLAPHCRVYAPDLPGHGRSRRLRWPLDVPAQADVLAAFVREAGFERVTLVANSLGCQVVAELAVRHPELVERLVLVGPTMDPAARTTLGQALRYARNIRHEKLPVILRCVFDYLRAGLLQCFRAFKLALHDRIEEKLPRVRAPTLVLRGERDPIAPERWVRQMVALLPFGRAGSLPGGHAAHHSSAGLLARTVMAFLREPPPA